MILILIGYMGSGKSTIGNLLAATLEYSFVDLDKEIEQREGISISQLFLVKGEIYFRTKENKVLRDLLSTHDNMVIATGGGTPCYGNITQLLSELQTVRSIYLKTDPEVLSHRLYPEKKERPLIAHLDAQDDLTDFIRKHLFERSFFYSEADYIIETDDITPRQTVEVIVTQLF